MKIKIAVFILATAGAAYQGVFRNPLADPYLLGVAAGAGFGATLAIAAGVPTAGSGYDVFARQSGRARGDASGAQSPGRPSGRPDGPVPAKLTLRGIALSYALQCVARISGPGF